MGNTFDDIRRQINSMIYLNTLSFSVLSGCGSEAAPEVRDMECIETFRQNSDYTQQPCNFSFLRCLYKKGMPQFNNELVSPNDLMGFRWVAKKQKRTIDIEVMACSIIACCSLIERILTCDLPIENPDFIIFLLHKSAVSQMKFIKKYLKIGNIYYCGEDITSEDGELHVQIAPENPDRASQFAVYHAMTALMQLNSYHLPNMEVNEESLIEDLGYLPVLLNRCMESLENCSTKELSNIGLHTAGIFKKSDLLSELVRKALAKIAKELCHRTSDTGEVFRNREDIEPCSISTKANCLNLLSTISYMFGSKSCREAVSKISGSIEKSWDSANMLYTFKDSNKQTYSIKDISSLLGGLYSYSLLLSEPEARDAHIQRFCDFYSFAFVKSGIFNGQAHPMLQESKMELHGAIRSELPWAPVFNKSFEFKVGKKKYYCEADVFRADYVMPAIIILLESINI